jgi:hypothetical protein
MESELDPGRRSAVIAVLLGAALAGLASLPSPDVADAAKKHKAEIVFRCRPNLCAVDVNGTHRRKLTTNGTDAHQYGTVAISRDGKRTVFQGKDGNPYTADGQLHHIKALPHKVSPATLPEIRANGKQVLWTYVANSFGGPFFTTETENFNGSNDTTTAAGDGSAGFVGATQFICASRNANHIYVGDFVATPPTGSPKPCRDVASEPVFASIFGYRPKVSPNGTRVVASFYRNGFSSDGIYLFNTANAALVAQLTHTDGDDNPVYSPDGKSILFDRVNGSSSDIYKLSAAGGTPKLLARGGSNASWSK